MWSKMTEAGIGKNKTNKKIDTSTPINFQVTLCSQSVSEVQSHHNCQTWWNTTPIKKILAHVDYNLATVKPKFFTSTLKIYSGYDLQ